MQNVRPCIMRRGEASYPLQKSYLMRVRMHQRWLLANSVRLSMLPRKQGTWLSKLYLKGAAQQIAEADAT